eukprot:2137275-Ditylum_brightwellii.AAC.1
MDNYFIIPKIIACLREMNIGVVGTSHFRKARPPKVLRNIMQQEARFNDFYWCVDEFGTLLGRWMDTGMAIWGNCRKKEIFIPWLIDNYNHWMGGVDLADQRIPYYHPDICSLWNWIPIFLQILSIMCNNANMLCTRTITVQMQ